MVKHITGNRRVRRKRRISRTVFGTAERPRISIFRSNRYIYAQAVDDEKKLTIVGYSSHVMSKEKGYAKKKKTEESKEAGLKLASALKNKHITQAVFDRGMYAYGGRVKSFAEGLREGGIQV